MSSHINKEKVGETISLLLEKMITQADPEELGEYYRLFKKGVPLFRRSWAAAYLLMLCDKGKGLGVMHKPRGGQPVNGTGGGTGGGANGGNAAGSANGGNGGIQSEDARRYPLSEEESKRLFFSIGRSRRVFPREILGLINTKTAVAKEDIGAIRILDNYSFVQVRDTVAEKIIEMLNGTSFRGRTLAVNYAKSRKDGEEGGGEKENELPEDVLSEAPEGIPPEAGENNLP